MKNKRGPVRIYILLITCFALKTSSEIQEISLPFSIFPFKPISPPRFSNSSPCSQFKFQNLQISSTKQALSNALLSKGQEVKSYRGRPNILPTKKLPFPRNRLKIKSHPHIHLEPFPVHSSPLKQSFKEKKKKNPLLRTIQHQVGKLART